MLARLLFFGLFVYSNVSFAQGALYICGGPEEVIKVEVIQSRIQIKLNGETQPIVEFKISKIIAKPIEELIKEQNIDVSGYTVKLDDQGIVTEVSESKIFGSTLTCIPVN
jgi:hypothetical protein